AQSIKPVTDSKTYDAEPTSSATPTVSGLHGTDTLTCRVPASDSPNAVALHVALPAYTVNDGNLGGNYSVTLHTASGSISARTLDIKAVTDAKTYDANTWSCPTPTTPGLQGTDTVTALVHALAPNNGVGSTPCMPHSKG